MFWRFLAEWFDAGFSKEEFAEMRCGRRRSRVAPFGDRERQISQ